MDKVQAHLASFDTDQADRSFDPPSDVWPVVRKTTPQNRFRSLRKRSSDLVTKCDDNLAQIGRQGIEKRLDRSATYHCRFTRYRARFSAPQKISGCLELVQNRFHQVFLLKNMLAKGWRSRTMLFDAGIMQDSFQEAHQTGALFIREKQIQFRHGRSPLVRVPTIQRRYMFSQPLRHFQD
jgi:hypothetical protein